MDDSAIKTDVFASFSDIGDKRTKEEIKKQNDPDDVALEALSNHRGWVVLNEYIESLKRQMDELVSSLISGGSNFEDVGKITVVSSLAKEKLYDIQKRIRDAKEAITGTE